MLSGRTSVALAMPDKLALSVAWACAVAGTSRHAEVPTNRMSRMDRMIGSTG
jgi:hypothetical protein